MKRLWPALALFCLLCAPALAADTPITKAQANVYFQNCMAQPSDNHISADTKGALCSCMSAQLVQNITSEQLAALDRTGPDTHEAVVAMLLNVAAPCMAYPVQDLVETQCRVDPKTAMTGTKLDRGQLCHCTGIRAGKWIAQNGRDVLAQIMKAVPGITDPINPVLATSAFKEAQAQGFADCLSGTPP